MRAFEVKSLDYLLKPYDRKRFGATLARGARRSASAFPPRRNWTPFCGRFARAPRRFAPPRARQGPRGPRPAPGSEGEPPGGSRSRERGPAFPRIGSRAGAARRSPCSLRRRSSGSKPRDNRFARAGAHRYVVSKTLTELEETLDPKRFFRRHRSFIVNLAVIAEIVPEESGNYRIIIRDPSRSAIPLSRRQARKLREVFPW